MKSPMPSLLILGSLLVASCMVSAQSCFTQMAGYKPDSNVVQHSRIDLDIEEIDDLTDIGNFTGALGLYTNGKFSSKAVGLRKLKAFSTDAQTLMAGQPYFELYKAYWSSATYSDDVMQAAANAASPFNGVVDVVRRETMLKTIQYQVVWMYVIREMEDAIDDCRAGNLNANDAGVLAWDEAWAFYSGSLEGVNGTGNGYSLYALAEKRCGQFGTCLSGKSLANRNILGLFAQGQALLRQGSCDAAEAVIPQIVRWMTIPLIQGVLRYVQRGSTNDNWAGTTTAFAKERAEGWAFVMAVLPQINNCSTSVAAKLRSNMNFNANPYMADGRTQLVAELQSTYKCLKVSCSEIGTMKEGATTIFPACTDALASGPQSGAASRVGDFLATPLIALVLVAISFF